MSDSPKKPSKAALRAESERQVFDFLKGRALEEMGRGEQQTARSISLTSARQQLFLEQFKEMAGEVFKGKLAPSGYALKLKKRRTKRLLNMLLSDLHIGARLEANQHPYPFGPEEESRRLAHVVMNAIEYKTDHRDDTELNLYLAGDVIEGLLMHELRSGAPLVEQAVAFMRHIVQALLLLSAHFPKVHVYCQTGNHGRNKLIHNARATHNKFDSHEGILYHAIKVAMEVGRIQNVDVQVPFTPYCAVPLFNHWAMVTHGDMGPVNFGNPGKNIDVGRITADIAKINANLTYEGHHYSVVAGGHVHTGAHIFLPGTRVIINPALIPPNWNALALGYVGNACGQWLWESVADHPVGDMRLIEVGPAQDKDERLDKYIAPFSFDQKVSGFYHPKRRF